jgi:branched-chain amino acid transport system permease protein
LDILGAVLIAGLTNGALYALATVGLSLVWGSMGMLNMAHGGLLTLGGYAAYTVVTGLGLPVPLGIVGAMAVGAVAGAVLYALVVARLLKADRSGFEANVMIATVGIGMALENAVLLTWGGQPLKQPVATSGVWQNGVIAVPWQNLMIIALVFVMMIAVTLLLGRTRMGRAIRATAQNRDAAELLGVASARVYLHVLMLSGAVAGVCGVMVSSMTQLSPPLGNDPMLKAFIMCVVAGLGNLPGAVIASFALAMIEAFVQFEFGARWGFPSLLILVIVLLIWRPSGVFGRSEIRRM